MGGTEKRAWPFGTFFLFVMLLSISFLDWGTLQFNLSEQMKDRYSNITMHGAGPTPPNYITGEHSLPVTGTLWQSGLQFVSVKIPFWSLVFAMAAILAIEVFSQAFLFKKIRVASYFLDAYGLIISSTSMISFLYQGYPGIGVIIAIFIFSCMAIFHLWQHNRIPLY